MRFVREAAEGWGEPKGIRESALVCLSVCLSVYLLAGLPAGYYSDLKEDVKVIEIKCRNLRSMLQ